MYKHSKAVVVKLLFLPEHAVLNILTVWGGGISGVIYVS